MRGMRGKPIHWSIDKEKTKTISRQVTKTRRNAQTGESETYQETETKRVKVMFHFENGKFKVDRNGNPSVWTMEDGTTKVNLTKGFNPNVKYVESSPPPPPPSLLLPPKNS